MSTSTNTKCIGVKAALYRTCMHANSFDGFPSNSVLTLLICLQCSDNNFGGRDVSKEVLHASRGRIDLLSAVLSRHLLERQLWSIERAATKLLGTI